MRFPNKSTMLLSTMPNFAKGFKKKTERQQDSMVTGTSGKRHSQFRVHKEEGYTQGIRIKTPTRSSLVAYLLQQYPILTVSLIF